MWKGITPIVIEFIWIAFIIWSDRDLALSKEDKIDKWGFDYVKRGYFYAVIIILLGIYVLTEIFS